MRSRTEYIAYESYGVKFSIHAARKEVLDELVARIGQILPEGHYREIAPRAAVHTFSIRESRNFRYVIYRGKRKIEYGNDRELVLKYLDWQIRLTIAEFAVERVFLHAGVVGWQGRAIIIPAKSFKGKTTLVKTLTNLGAEYYSDEYAVLDAQGFVHPFPKMLSIRGFEGDYRQTDFTIESLGGIRGKAPIPVGLILITEFEPGADWQPRILSEGEGVMEMLSHTIPIRYNPKFSLKVLNKTVNHAIIVKTKRGEAKDFAVKLLSFFENKA